jgi:malonate transporter
LSFGLAAPYPPLTFQVRFPTSLQGTGRLQPDGPDEIQSGVTLSSVATDIILPLFGIMLAGYFFGRFRILTEGSSAVLSRFVFVVALPALIFVHLARLPAGDFFHMRFLATLGGGMLAVFLLGLLATRLFFPGSLTDRGLHALTAMYSSTGYIGLPLVLLAFGDEALVPGIIGAVITGAVFLPLAIILAEIDKGRGGGKVLGQVALAVLKNPVLLATAAGLSVSASGFILPGPVVTFCELLGGAFIPCALFSAGLYMVGASVKGQAGEVGWLVGAKLLLHPAITWWLAYHVFDLEPTLAAITVLQAALPSGVPVFVLAQHYNTFQARANAAIVLSTTLSVLTLSALLFFLQV